ncbi:hypothetical protein F5B20DRAFT_574150 [Whalleya microplaca]|nr:hypothetical protein F5B20DRAFT_574150 [Whalleya microplaca]
MGSTIDLPSSESSELCLCQPTPEECTQIWFNSAASWKDSLTIPLYLIEAQCLTKIPLAKDGGMATESFRKRSLTSDERGNIEKGLVHGIASVFCSSWFRGRDYGTRHMKELAKVLHGWQSEYGKSIGSALSSDIGKNGHFVFPPVKLEKAVLAQLVPESELETLCLGRRVLIPPDLDHMLWHIRKEDFATNHIFGKKLQAKGAIAGNPSKQVWAVWVHHYYEHPDYPEEEEAGGNVLYILRLVMEAAALKAVLQAAQAEAAEWRLDQVKLWEPSPLVQSLLEQRGLDATWVERQERSIANKAPAWVNNEHYAWC